MHRFSSTSAILRLKIAAILFCGIYLLVPVVAGVLIYSILRSNHQLTLIAIGMGMMTILITLVQWIVATRTRCPLCLTPVLARKNCSKHRNARTALGSYRLRVALAVLFRGSFLCPYCHEPSALAVRSRRARSGSRRF